MKGQHAEQSAVEGAFVTGFEHRDTERGVSPHAMNIRQRSVGTGRIRVKFQRALCQRLGFIQFPGFKQRIGQRRDCAAIVRLGGHSDSQVRNGFIDAAQCEARRSEALMRGNEIRRGLQSRQILQARRVMALQQRQPMRKIVARSRQPGIDFQRLAISQQRVIKLIAAFTRNAEIDPRFGVAR